MVKQGWIKPTRHLIKCHFDKYQRVLYHFGNSHFHAHMFNLLETIPGVIVLHDFFLSHIVTGLHDKTLPVKLYESHGYSAAKEASKKNVRNIENIIWKKEGLNPRPLQCLKLWKATLHLQPPTPFTWEASMWPDRCIRNAVNHGTVSFLSVRQLWMTLWSTSYTAGLQIQQSEFKS